MRHSERFWYLVKLILPPGTRKGTYSCFAHSSPSPVFAPVMTYVFPERLTSGRNGLPYTWPPRYCLISAREGIIWLILTASFAGAGLDDSDVHFLQTLKRQRSMVPTSLYSPLYDRKLNRPSRNPSFYIVASVLKSRALRAPIPLSELAKHKH